MGVVKLRMPGCYSFAFFYFAPSLVAFTVTAGGWTSLHNEVVRCDNIADIEMRLSRGIDVNARCLRRGYSLLHVFAARGEESVVRLLMNYKDLDANIRTDGVATYRSTPLHLAVVAGKEEIVKQLLSDGRVDPNAQDHWGGTPLHAAIFSGCFDVLRMLLCNFRVNPNVRDVYGRTPLHYLVKCGIPQEPLVKRNMIPLVTTELRCKRQYYFRHRDLSKRVEEECSRILLNDFEGATNEVVRRAHQLCGLF